MIKATHFGAIIVVGKFFDIVLFRSKETEFYRREGGVTIGLDLDGFAIKRKESGTTECRDRQ
jgi:hypothetical protein